MPHDSYSSPRRRLTRLIGRTLTGIPALARLWGRHFAAMSADSVPFIAPQRPLRHSRIALVTTGGVHLRSDPPFDMADPRGDASFRVIPAATPPEQLMITHDYYDHRDADRDMNVLFPLALLRDLARAGTIGALGNSYGFMGHIEPPHVATLLERSAPAVARRMLSEGIDAVLLSPG